MTTTTLTPAERQANTLSAVRENINMRPNDWNALAHSKRGTLKFIDLCVDAYVESEPERYASLSSEQADLLASEVAERFN